MNINLKDPKEMDRVMSEMQRNTDIMCKIDPSKLPYELAIKLLNAYGNLIDSMKAFNDEVNQVIAMGIILNRIDLTDYEKEK